MARSEKYSSVAFVGINYFANPGQDKYGAKRSSQEVKEVEKETNSVFMSKSEHETELSRVRERKRKEEKKREEDCFNKINRDVLRVLDV